MMEGEKIESHQKGYFWSWSVFSPLRILTSTLFKETLGVFLFLPLFLPLFLSFFNSFSLSSFFYAPSLEDLGGDDISREKSLLQKLSFQMEWHGHDCGYTGGGRIFQNGVMHANIPKPWLWRCGSCGYIGNGRIFWSGGMHANISGWG
jgi:hypothetical protein